MTNKIGVIGTGIVGDTLSNGFLAKGYAVQRASREPAKLQGWLDGTKRVASIGATSPGAASIGGLAETAAWADIVVLAVKGLGAEDAVAAAGPANLAGKLVLDATNPIADGPPKNGALRFFTGGDESLLERLQARAPEAKFVKAWNSVGAYLMVDPKLPSAPSMFICGADAEAKQRTAAILQAFGWESVDVGGVEMGHAVEALCILWCAPGFLRNDWAHAFKYLTPA